MHQKPHFLVIKQIQKLKYLFVSVQKLKVVVGGYRNPVCMHFYVYAHDISFLERCVVLIKVFVSG